MANLDFTRDPGRRNCGHAEASFEDYGDEGYLNYQTEFGGGRSPFFQMGAIALHHPLIQLTRARVHGIQYPYSSCMVTRALIHALFHKANGLLTWRFASAYISERADYAADAQN